MSRPETGTAPTRAPRPPARLPRQPAAARRRTQAERSEETRLRLVQAAARLLHKKGYAGLRTAEVSALAGVSRGGQLHHFPTKDSLVIATAEHILQRSAEAGRRRALEAHGDRELLDAIIEDSVEFFFSDDFLSILDLVLTGSKNRKVRESVHASARAFRIPVENAWIAALARHGLPREEAEKLLWVTVSVVRGLALRAVWQKDPELFRAVLDTTRQMVLRRWADAIGGAKGATR